MKEEVGKKNETECFVVGISASFIFNAIESADNFDEMVEDGEYIYKEKAHEFALDIADGFMSRIKTDPLLKDIIGEKFLIIQVDETGAGATFYEMNEGISNKKITDYGSAKLFFSLKEVVQSWQLDQLFLKMDDYSFYAFFPHGQSEIITQGYDNGEYDTGYFSMDDNERYIVSRFIGTSELHKSAKIILSKV